MPHFLHQSNRIFNSFYETKQSSIEETQRQMFKETANNRKWQFLETKDMSLINTSNNIGDKWTLCSVPDGLSKLLIIGVVIEKKFWTLVSWNLLVK